jgi:ATP-dependent Clp protease adaptor protein ClpS
MHNRPVGAFTSMPGELETTAVAVEPDVTTEQQTRRLPPYNVVILNDEEHTFPYVIELLTKIFRHPLPTAQELTHRIDATGRAIVYTTHKELAELKRDQVIAYGPDPRVPTCKGPLRCYVEPAPTG